MRDHFRERVAQARARWQVVDLDISFRSTAAVLAAVDGVFASATPSCAASLATWKWRSASHWPSAWPNSPKGPVSPDR